MCVCVYMWVSICVFVLRYVVGCLIPLFISKVCREACLYQHCLPRSLLAQSGICPTLSIIPSAKVDEQVHFVTGLAFMTQSTHARVHTLTHTHTHIVYTGTMLLCNRCGIHFMRYKKLPGPKAANQQVRAC